MQSPWSYLLNLPSPDGSCIALIENAMEIAMGAPTSGTLIIDCGIEIPNCNPSAVWSTDSKYLAIPQWNNQRKQKLLVISVRDKKRYLIGCPYSVLELEKFEDKKITGIDSPIYNPKKVVIEFSENQ